MQRIVRNIFAGLVLAAMPTFAWGLPGTGPASDRIGGTPAPGYVPQALVDVGINERLGEQVPLDLTFTDETGQTVRLGDLIGQRPVILQLGYFECPMLCGLVAQGWISSIQKLDLELGADYQVISISIDPRETPEQAAQKKQSFLAGVDKPLNAAGVHYLVGSEASIKAITEATGFGYKWVPSAGQFSHPAAITLLTPQGRVAQYLYGIEYPPDQLRSAIETAARGRSQSSINAFLMTCFQMAGVSPVNALAIMRGAGAVTVVALAGIVFTLVRRTNRRLAEAEQAGSPVTSTGTNDQ